MNQPKPPSPTKRHQPTTKPRRVYTGRPSRHTPYRRGSKHRPIRREISAGGVVARQEHKQWLVALLKTEHKRGPVWILPKGHVEPAAGETVADAAKREVQEEAGITSLSVKDQLGVTRYSFQAETALVKKTVHYFLMTTEQKKLTPQAEENLLAAAWHPIDQAISCLEYDSDKNIVAKAKAKLTGQPVQPVHRSAIKPAHSTPADHRRFSPRLHARSSRTSRGTVRPRRIHT